MKAIEVEVIGIEPPCPRCKKAMENAINAAARFYEETGMITNVNKLNISSKEVIEKYGLIMSPAIAVNGVVKIMGKVPDVGVIKRILSQEVEAD